jgi:hypothetical protein
MQFVSCVCVCVYYYGFLDQDLVIARKAVQWWAISQHNFILRQNLTDWQAIDNLCATSPAEAGILIV